MNKETNLNCSVAICLCHTKQPVEIRLLLGRMHQDSCNAQLRHGTCLKTISLSEECRHSCSPPCSTTIAPGDTVPSSFSFSHSRRRLSANRDMATERQSGPILKTGLEVGRRGVNRVPALLHSSRDRPASSSSHLLLCVSGVKDRTLCARACVENARCCCELRR